MYWGEIDSKRISLAWKQGLHPSILAGGPSRSSSKLPK
jgi:hypothetical protein